MLLEGRNAENGSDLAEERGGGAMGAGHQQQVLGLKEESIWMRDLLSALESEDIQVQKQLTEYCTFIIECNTCWNLFRCLGHYFGHCKECATTAHTYLGDENEDVQTNETRILANDLDNDESSKVISTDELTTNSPAPVQGEDAAQLDLRNRIGQKRDQLSAAVETLKSGDESVVSMKESEKNSSIESDCRKNETEMVDVDEIENEEEEDVNVVDDSFLSTEGDATKEVDDLGVTSEGAEEGVALVECVYCSELFLSEAERDTHVRLDCPQMLSFGGGDKDEAGDGSGGKKQKQYHCYRCDIVFPTRSTLSQHVSTFHRAVKGSLTNSLECGICHKKYASERTLMRHNSYVHGLHTSSGFQSSNSSTDPQTRLWKCLKSYTSSRPRGRPRGRDRGRGKSRGSGRDRENIRPPLDAVAQKRPRGRPPKSNRGLTPAEIIGGRIADEELSIYLDDDAKQCLICFSRYPARSLVIKHIREAHADSLNSTPSHSLIATPLSPIVPEVPIVPLSLPDQQPGIIYLDKESQLLSCALCGKSFESASEREQHMLLPHKITAIKH